MRAATGRRHSSCARTGAGCDEDERVDQGRSVRSCVLSRLQLVERVSERYVVKKQSTPRCTAMLWVDDESRY